MKRYDNELEATKAGVTVFAYDFDATLSEYEKWDDGKTGPPIKKVCDHLRAAYKRGVYIVIFTTRCNVRLWGVLEAHKRRIQIKEWLREHDLYECVSMIVGDKPLADKYFDDRAVNVEDISEGKDVKTK